MPKPDADEDVEHGSPGPKARIQQLQRTYHSIPRILRILLIGCILLFVAKDLSIRIQGDFDYKLKILPTDFASLEHKSSDALWLPEQPVRHVNDTNIGDRYVFMRHLGTGNEGSASLYVDVRTGEVVAVKIWSGPLKNIRNHVPASLGHAFEHFTDKWPSEIEAGLLLETWNNKNDTAFVSVRDYFVLQRDTKEWNWAMVTPLVEGGTLLTLAETTKIHERTQRKLDKIFRPAFNSLLKKLSELHEAGYCHDDIKPDNVFIRNTTHWLLGDLGNVRHFDHPWHETARWKRESQWPDCKRNDVRRMLKTYMVFLREAGASKAAFDHWFYAEDQAWSRLYWDYMDTPVSAHQLLTMSESLRSGDGVEFKTVPNDSTGNEAYLSRKIDRELTFWSVKTDWLDWLPFKGC